MQIYLRICKKNRTFAALFRGDGFVYVQILVILS